MLGTDEDGGQVVGDPLKTPSIHIRLEQTNGGRLLRFGDFSAKALEANRVWNLDLVQMRVRKRLPDPFQQGDGFCRVRLEDEGLHENRRVNVRGHRSPRS